MIRAALIIVALAISPAHALELAQVAARRRSRDPGRRCCACRDLHRSQRTHGFRGAGNFAGPRIERRSARDRRPGLFSDRYFSSLLGGHAARLLTTSGLMAPEAYTLDAALVAWFGGANADAVREAAARAYASYQRIPEKSAGRLFLTEAGNP